MCLCILYFERGGNGDALADGARYGAVGRVEAVDALCGFAVFRRELDVIAHMDAPDDQHFAVQFNLTRCF